MTATPNYASEAPARDEAGESAATAAGAVPFVLNLCSSTTPMALAQTDLPELKRFTFFVSRRFEEGRERFRLHMGYFATLAEAEEWLGVVREIYPGAWAGEAPGRKLRERAAAANAAQAQHAAGPHITPTPARASAPPPPRVPVVHAAPAAPRAAALPATPTASPPVVRPAARQMAVPPAFARSRPTARQAFTATPPAAATPKTPPTPRPAPQARTAAPAPILRPAAGGASLLAPHQGAARPAPGLPARTAVKGAKPVFEDSNVREVLKALGDASATGETRLMQAPVPPRAPAGLSDTQVLRMLETRRPEGSPEPGPAGAEVSHGSIPLLKPDDTGTRQALKEALASSAPVAFAVQLQWSVQPAELDKVPPLAIFSAYTLYTVEGSREGRKWYGLRLGFFSDAISAKQVAYYVRSEFTSVAVVPVSPQEKARATDQDMKAAMLAAPALPRGTVDEFKLIDDEPTVPALDPAVAAAAGAKPQAKGAAKPPGRPLRGPAGTRERKAGRVGARARSGPQTLEETLEILGASELTIDSGRGESVNESGVRHLRVEVQKNSPFSKLLERLSERMKKP
jgi:hypothetical protein